MRRKLSKKQIGAMGLAAMMAAQTPAMAAETSQEAAAQETTQELQITEPQNEVPLAEEVETTESQIEEVGTVELQTEEQSKAQSVEETEIETVAITETEENVKESTDAADVEISASEIESLIDQYALTENQTALEDGWHKDADGNDTYVKDGELVRNEVIEIDGKYYGFGYNGILYRNESFYTWDYSGNSSNTIFYRAKEDGSLYVNEWYELWGDRYYYGENGAAYSGIHTVDGKTYCFAEIGNIYTERCVLVDGKSYYCNSEGIISPVLNEGWNEAEGKYFYVKDGAYLSKIVTEIDGKYYGFDGLGIRYTDQQFSIWSDDDQIQYNYRAKRDGSLYVNEWYETEFGDMYYYGEDGNAYFGFHEIDGVRYCFNEYGKVAKNECVTIDGAHYYCDAEGQATQLNEGWNHIEESYFYVKDGALLTSYVYKIGNSYYGFDSNGKMYVNTGFWSIDFETRDNGYYLAKEDGSLYVNEWYQNEYEEIFYYGNNGIRYVGIQSIGDKIYCFGDYGYLCKKQCFTDEDGKIYYCDKDGVATEMPNNGWSQFDGQYFYVMDGEVLENCVRKIGDAYYGFDSHGAMYTDISFGIWNNEGRGNYRAKSDGTLYVNEWYIPENLYENPYYYGEDANAYIGLHEIDGKLYYFSDYGRIYKNQSVTTDDGANYYCDSDGIAIPMENNSWFEIDGKYLYVKDGKVLKGCVEKIGDFYYGFDYDGIRYTDTTFDLLDSESQRWVYYRAKSDGRLYANEWYTSNGDAYYYGEGGKSYSGLHEIDGTQYYFSDLGEVYKNRGITTEDGELYYCDSNGKAIKIEANGWFEVNGKYLYIKDGKFLTNSVAEINGVYYGFDYYGIMHTNTTFSIWDYENNVNNYYRAKKDGSLYVSEWYGDYTKYYYGEEGKAYSGLKTVDGKQYYFGSDGEVQRNCSVSVDGKNIYCDNYGVVYELNDNGWNKIGDDYLYVKDGKILKGCVVQINGAYYAFDSSGVMYHDITFNMWSADYHEENYYWASPSGALYTNTWSDNGYSMYYYGSDAKRCKGVQTIDGIQYGFDSRGNLVMSETLTIDGVNYYCDEEGRTDVIPDNQWYKDKNGYWYYSLDGTLLRNCSEQIGTTWYRFDGQGRMQTQGLNVNADGSLRINTWVYDGDWHYYGEYGQVYGKGIFEIAGATYYFENEKMVVSKVISVNGTSYIADANGYLTKIPENGWILAGSDYYYAEDGKLITWKVKEINGVCYAFDGSGKMAKDGEYLFTFGRCRARADGSLYVSQWYQDLDGSWYYYDQNAVRVIDEAEINGVHYLFDTTNALKTNGVVQRSGKYYLADENGIWVQTPGWVQKNNCWYYVQQDGTLYQGLLKDGGYTYYMSPRMMMDLELTAVDGIAYTMDRNGHASVAADGFYTMGLSNPLLY